MVENYAAVACAPFPELRLVLHLYVMALCDFDDLRQTDQLDRTGA